MWPGGGCAGAGGVAGVLCSAMLCYAASTAVVRRGAVHLVAVGAGGLGMNGNVQGAVGAGKASETVRQTLARPRLASVATAQAQNARTSRDKE